MRYTGDIEMIFYPEKELLEEFYNYRISEHLYLKPVEEWSVMCPLKVWIFFMILFVKVKFNMWITIVNVIILVSVAILH